MSAALVLADRALAGPDDPFGLVGSVIDGRYRIDSVAGRGGFGVVYRALHLGFDSPIAVKLLSLPGRWSAAKKRRRIEAFQREGRVIFALAQLDVHIVRAFETGTVLLHDGAPAPYLALEWLSGTSLAAELALRASRAMAPLSLAEVIGLLDGPAAALGRAHARGIVHRDIKPGNLFVTFSDGRPLVKILDFGIAQAVEAIASIEARDEGPATSEAAPCLDGAGAFTMAPGATSLATSAFTPRYAAPEQWDPALGVTGKPTDVHAWALVCAELITGRAPVAGESAAELRANCVRRVLRPTPGTLGLDLGPAVEAVFSRALAVDPRERYPDIDGFWTALREAARWSPAAPTTLVIAAAHAADPGAGGAPRAARAPAAPPGVTGATATSAPRPPVSPDPAPTTIPMFVLGPLAKPERPRSPDRRARRRPLLAAVVLAGAVAALASFAVARRPAHHAVGWAAARTPIAESPRAVANEGAGQAPPAQHLAPADEDQDRPPAVARMRFDGLGPLRGAAAATGDSPVVARRRGVGHAVLPAAGRRQSSAGGPAPETLPHGDASSSSAAPAAPPPPAPKTLESLMQDTEFAYRR